MNSLEELNDHSRTFVSITDDRPAGVILDRAKPYAFQFNENQVFISYDGTPWDIEWDIAEIEEIPNWETAKCYFMVEVFSDDPDLYGLSGIFFDVIPGGVTEPYSELVPVIEDESTNEPVGRVAIKAQYFKTKEEWIQFGRGKFLWEQPSINELNTSLIYYARVSLNWTDAETNTQQRIRFEVFDPGWYYDVNMESEFTFVGDFNQTKAVVSNMTSSFALTSTSTGRKEAFANLVSTSTLTALSENIALVSSFTLSGSTVITTNITNMVNRTYLGNTGNNLFASNTPVVDNLDPNAVYTITLTSPLGEFGTGSTASTTYSFTGTKTQVNNNWANIRFYPNKNVTSTTSFTYTQTVGGVTLVNRTLSLTNQGGLAGAQPENTYNILNSGTWTPTALERKYSRMSFTLSAGGGGGGSNSTFDRDLVLQGTVNYLSGGGGGSAGQLVLQTNQDILNSSYSVTIGNGGAGAPFGSSFGDGGGDSIFAGVTAKGGLGGRAWPVSVPNKTGADSNYVGGFSGGFTTSFSGPHRGGGGAGTNGNGPDNGQVSFNQAVVNIRENPIIAIFGGAGGVGGGTTTRSPNTEFGSGGHGAQISTGNTPSSINPNSSFAGVKGKLTIITHP